VGRATPPTPVPAGTVYQSPPFQRWGCVRNEASPGARIAGEETAHGDVHIPSLRRTAAPGLRAIREFPSAEALGFDMSALRACGEDSPP